MTGYGSTLFVPILDEDAAINNGQSMLADEGKPKSERLRSLDAFRGLVITGAVRVPITQVECCFPCRNMSVYCFGCLISFDLSCGGLLLQS